MSKHKIGHNEKFSPLAIKLREISAIKQAINNSHLHPNTKFAMMKEMDCQYNQAWRNHYNNVIGYEIVAPHPMRTITRVMKKLYDMSDVYVKEVNGKIEYVQGQNDHIIMLVVLPHDNMKKWMLRVAPRVTFDRWANSTVIETFFDRQDILCNYIENNKAEIIEKMFVSLSKEIDESSNEECHQDNDEDAVNKHVDNIGMIRVYNRTNKSGDLFCDMHVKNLYKLIADYVHEGYDVTANEVATIISWLPSLQSIEVFTFVVNNYIKLHFDNGNEVEFINTGIEEMLSDYVVENGKPVV